MKKNNIVRKKYEFDNIIKTGSCIKNSYYIIFYKGNNLDKYRFGISVGKKLGNAVLRNKYKRKIRNIIDNNKKYYQKSFDYIIIMRKSSIDSKFELLEEKFVSLINIINQKGDNNEK